MSEQGLKIDLKKLLQVVMMMMMMLKMMLMALVGFLVVKSLNLETMRYWTRHVNGLVLILATEIAIFDFFDLWEVAVVLVVLVVVVVVLPVLVVMVVVVVGSWLLLVVVAVGLA